jgi:hypothetical protein
MGAWWHRSSACGSARSARAAMLLGVAAALLAAGCGGGDEVQAEPAAADDVVVEEVATPDGSGGSSGQDWTGPLPGDLRPRQVCKLVGDDVVATAVGAEITEVRPSETGTPQCNWWYQEPGGPSTNVVVAVQRAEDDLDGRAGRDAYEYALELNETYLGEPSFTEVDGIGEAATLVAGSSAQGIVVLAPDGRVVTVFGRLDDAAKQAVASAAVEGLAARTGA